MINPLFSSTQTATYTAPAQDFGRVINMPEPAKVVTATDTALDARLDARNQQQQQQPAEAKQLDDTIKELNQRMQAWSTGLRFSVDEEAQRVVVSLVDTASGEVIRTVPSDAVLKVAKMIVQLQGQIIDTQA